MRAHGSWETVPGSIPGKILRATPGATPGTIRKAIPKARHCLGEVRALGYTPALLGPFSTTCADTRESASTPPPFPDYSRERPPGQCQAHSADKSEERGMASTTCGDTRESASTFRATPGESPESSRGQCLQYLIENSLKQGIHRCRAIPDQSAPPPHGPFPEGSLGRPPEQSAMKSSHPRIPHQGKHLPGIKKPASRLDGVLDFKKTRTSPRRGHYF